MSRPHRKADRVSLDDFEEMLAGKPEDEKWELIDGRIYKGMVGARIEHHLIIDNMGVALSIHFRGRGMPCRALRETFYLKEQKDELSTFPDLMVRCGAIELGATSINDPIALIEVVSPGSEEKDRLTKRVAYQRLPSLQHYVLVSRDRMLVDQHNRSKNGWRDAEQLDKPGDVLRLAAIEFEMNLAEIYRDVIESDQA